MLLPIQRGGPGPWIQLDYPLVIGIHQPQLIAAAADAFGKTQVTPIMRPLVSGGRKLHHLMTGPLSEIDTITGAINIETMTPGGPGIAKRAAFTRIGTASIQRGAAIPTIDKLLAPPFELIVGHTGQTQISVEPGIGTANPNQKIVIGKITDIAHQVRQSQPAQIKHGSILAGFTLGNQESVRLQAQVPAGVTLQKIDTNPGLGPTAGSPETHSDRNKKQKNDGNCDSRINILIHAASF